MLFPAIYTLVNYELATVFDDIEKSRVPAEIETIRLKLISCLKQRFDFLLNNNDTSKVYWAMTFLDCRFKGFSFISKIEERKAKLQIAKEFLETYYATLPEKTSSPEKIVSQSDDTPTCAQPEVNAGNKRDRPSYLKNILDKRFSESVTVGPKQSIKKELDEYENDYSFLTRTDQEKFDLINNPLDFYKFYSQKYPTVSRLARNLLCVTGTSVPSECLFSHVGLIATKLRSRLSPMLLESLTLIKDNVKE
jgi:hypothetical protein